MSIYLYSLEISFELFTLVILVKSSNIKLVLFELVLQNTLIKGRSPCGLMDLLFTSISYTS